MISRDELNEKMKGLLGNKDFGKYIKHLYKNYKDIYQLLPGWEDYRIILIEQKPRMGHWVCLTRRNEIFIFFDSYGYNPFQN